MPDVVKIWFNAATPPLRLTRPRDNVPDLKVMVPVGVPPNCAVTVAVNVVLWFATEGFTDDVSAVMVEAWLTASGTVFELHPEKFGSPL